MFLVWSLVSRFRFLMVGSLWSMINIVNECVSLRCSLCCYRLF